MSALVIQEMSDQIYQFFTDKTMPLDQQIQTVDDFEFQQKLKQFKLNGKGQPLCAGYRECEVKQTLADQCDNHGKDSLTEEQQALLESNVCICGEWDDVMHALNIPIPSTEKVINDAD